MHISSPLFFFFFTDTATPEIYTLSLHDALPISFMGRAALHRRRLGVDRDRRRPLQLEAVGRDPYSGVGLAHHLGEDRKSTRLNSSHVEISYAVFCLKKKKKKKKKKQH